MKKKIKTDKEKNSVKSQHKIRFHDFYTTANFVILIVLIAAMLLIKIMADSYLVPNSQGPRQAVFPVGEIAVVALLGMIGTYFYRLAGFPDVLSIFKNKPKILFFSIISGILFGMVFMVYDFFAVIGNINAPGISGLLFYVWGAISTEVITKLFLASFLIWLLSLVSRKLGLSRISNYSGQMVFIMLSIVFAAGMLASFSNPAIPLIKPSPILFALLGVLVFTAEYLSFRLFNKYGIVSSLFYRFGLCLVWHIIWPLIFY